MRDLVRVLRQRFVVVFARRHRVEAEVELILPAEVKAGAGQRIVAKLRRRMTLGEIGGMRKPEETKSMKLWGAATVRALLKAQASGPPS